MDQHNLATKKALQELRTTLLAKKWTLSVAESCTGGMLCAEITSIAGSSAWFDRGFITYSNAAKEEMLGVPHQILRQFGAVSEATAAAMANGVINNSQSQISVSITGIAGPSGGTLDKPVGTVCFAWSLQSAQTQQFTQHFRGDRQAVRQQAILFAIQGLNRTLEDTN